MVIIAKTTIIVQKGISPVTCNDPQLVDEDSAGTYVSLAIYTGLNLAKVAYTGYGGVPLRFNSQAFLFPGGTFWQTPQTVTGTKVESPMLARAEAGFFAAQWQTGIGLFR